MNTARKSIVVAFFATSMLAGLSGCTTTGCQANHPFSTMFIDHEARASQHALETPNTPAKPADPVYTADAYSIHDRNLF